MHVRTDRYGTTQIHLQRGEVAHAPSLHTRVSAACAKFGISERGTGRTRARAIALIERHPVLTAEQAVEVVLAGLDKEAA